MTKLTISNAVVVISIASLHENFASLLQASILCLYLTRLRRWWLIMFINLMVRSQIPSVDRPWWQLMTPWAQAPINFGGDLGPNFSSVLTDTDHYSIEVEFLVADVSSYRDVIIFNNLTQDITLYILNGRLRLYNYVEVSEVCISNNNTHWLVITRDGITKQFKRIRGWHRKTLSYGYQQEVRKMIRFYPWAFMARGPRAAVVLEALALRSMMKGPYSISSPSAAAITSRASITLQAVRPTAPASERSQALKTANEDLYHGSSCAHSRWSGRGSPPGHP